jgi:hypothetical protein
MLAQPALPRKKVRTKLRTFSEKRLAEMLAGLPGGGRAEPPQLYQFVESVEV